MIKPEEIKKILGKETLKTKKINPSIDYLPCLKIVIGPSKLPKVKE